MPNPSPRSLSFSGGFKQRNYLEGPIPRAVGTLAALASFRVQRNVLTGCMPHALETLRLLQTLDTGNNWLAGYIPPSLLGSMTLLSKFRIFDNQFSGELPSSVASMTRATYVLISTNQLSGCIPKAVDSMTSMQSVWLAENEFRGHLPEGLMRGHHLKFLDVAKNSFSGPALAGAVTRSLRHFEAACNQLAGALPKDLARIMDLLLQHNQLEGPLPHSIQLAELDLSDNVLAGTIPCRTNVEILYLGNNKLTGSLPPDLITHSLKVLGCSGNMLSGSIPMHLRNESLQLQMLDLSGLVGAQRSLRGPLPVSLARAVDLSVFLARNQRLEGNVPALPSTLHLLVVCQNLLKSLPDMHMNESSVILLHQNLFSCYTPQLGRIRANLSLAAFGNCFWHPDRDFPDWIMPVERDGLFWKSNTEGHMFGFKFLVGAFAFAGAVLKRFGVSSLGAIRRWQAAVGHHAALACTSSHLLSCMTRLTIWSVAFIMYLLPWHVYSCPRTFALASACLRDSTSVRVFVVVSWGALALEIRQSGRGWRRRSSAAGPLSRTAAVFATAGQVMKRCVSRVCWLLLALLLSMLAALDQAGKCIPGFFSIGNGVQQVVSVCIGLVQSIIIRLVIPLFAARLPSSRAQHFFEELTCLLASCMVPAFVIVLLDDACLEHWTYFWEPCSARRAGQFQSTYAFKGSIDLLSDYMIITSLSSSDICKPQRQASAAACVHVALLRLQDVWLSKWITLGLILPTCSVLRGETSKDPVKVLQQLMLYQR